MADQGPLVRVDINDGRGTVLKLTRKEAEARVAAGGGAKIIATPDRPDPDAVPELNAEGRRAAPAVDRSFDGLDQMNKGEVVAFARQEGIDDSGTKADIVERIRAAHAARVADAEGQGAETSEAEGQGAGADGSENAPGE